MTLASVVAHDDEQKWQEARRPLATATQVRDWATGQPSERSRILVEKITGAREDLAAVKYIEWGKFREPFLQDWVRQKYDIDPVERDLYISTEYPRFGCTPDGYSDAFGIISLSELKTTKHDLRPGTGKFLESGYEDQIQWEMLVTGAERVLFVWEQHDDVWEPWPTPYPPQAVWIERDQTRIDKLVEFAHEMLEAVDRWQHAYQVMLDKCVSDAERIAAESALVAHIKADHTSTKGLEDRWLFIVGGDLAPEADPLALGTLPDELTELGRIVLQARVEEADAKKRKEEAWKRIGELTREHKDFKAARDGVVIGWSTSTGTKKVVDTDGMRAKAPSIVKRYEDLQARFTRDEPTETRTMTVLKQD